MINIQVACWRCKRGYTIKLKTPDLRQALEENGWLIQMLQPSMKHPAFEGEFAMCPACRKETEQ